MVAEEPAAESSAAAAETPAATETPKEEAKEEAAKEPEAAEASTPVEETKAKAVEKPTPSKRTRFVNAHLLDSKMHMLTFSPSIFGGLSFGKKKAEEAAPATPAKDTTPEVAEVSQIVISP